MSFQCFSLLLLLLMSSCIPTAVKALSSNNSWKDFPILAFFSNNTTRSDDDDDSSAIKKLSTVNMGGSNRTSSSNICRMDSDYLQELVKATCYQCILQMFWLLLLLLTSSCIYPLNSFNVTAVKADVGVILDLQTTLGKIFKTCISMAIEDFYSKNIYNTVIVLHFKDSGSDVVDAASAAIDLLKNTQVVAIFGPQGSTEAEFVIEIGGKVKVPTISPATSPSLLPQESPYFIISSWCSSSQAKAVASIVENFGWREVVFIYEDTDYASQLAPFFTEELLKNNALVSCQSSVSPSAENHQILQQLYELKKKQPRVFVVHMAPPLASRFLQIVREAGMMSKGYVWIIADPLTSLLDSETIEEIQGIIGVKAYFSKSDKVINFTRR
ncbi:hypothetical protein OROHE_017967 [Orobanche hederae]